MPKHEIYVGKVDLNMNDVVFQKHLCGLGAGEGVVQVVKKTNCSYALIQYKTKKQATQATAMLHAKYSVVKPSNNQLRLDMLRQARTKTLPHPNNFSTWICITQGQKALLVNNALGERLKKLKDGQSVCFLHL